jgi:hypothetical protein
VQAAQYKELAERQNRSSIHEGFVKLARQCAAMANALASAKVDQSTKLSEAEILDLLDEMMAGGKSEFSVPAAQPLQSPVLMAVPPRELSLDEILQKVQRDIAEGGRLPTDSGQLSRFGRVQPGHSGLEVVGKLQEAFAYEGALLGFRHFSVARYQGAVSRNQFLRRHRDRLAQERWV